MRILIGGCVYRLNAVRSVHKTEVKILPYRPTKLSKTFIIWLNKKTLIHLM